jgi:hypothetical protein
VKLILFYLSKKAFPNHCLTRAHAPLGLETIAPNNPIINTKIITILIMLSVLDFNATIITTSRREGYQPTSEEVVRNERTWLSVFVLRQPQKTHLATPAGL